MEYLFQADINGALERLDRIENGHEQSNHRSSTDIIFWTLKSTLESLNSNCESVYLQAPGYQTKVQDPNDVCHAVLFKAWIRRTDALTSFSVSRYSRGVLPKEYYQVMETLHFTNYFKTSIYNLDPEVAMPALQELLPHIETCRLYDYLPTYLRVYQGINSEQPFTFSIDHLCQHLSNHTLDTQSVQQILSTLLAIYTSDIQLSAYHCIGLYRLVIHLHLSSQDIIQNHLLSTWKRLLKWIHGKYTAILSCANMNILLPPSDLDDGALSKQDPLINMDDTRLCYSSLDLNMVELWNRSSGSPHQQHEYAFELICKGIWKYAVPSRNTTITNDQLLTPDGSNAQQRWSHASDVLSTYLTKYELEVDIDLDLYSCMVSCMETLRSLSGSWKSILKAMTQFSDIWIRILPNNEGLTAFADLIVIAGTWTSLYRFVINVINVPCGDGSIELVNEQQKSSLCVLVRMVLEQLPTNILLELIYDTYSDSSLPIDRNTSLPFKQSLFNDMATLQKCCNQLVHTEQNDMTSSSDPQAEPRLLHQLAVLAVLSPYDVVWRLVNHGIENKGQHGLVVSILRQLGNLCMLRRYPGDRTLMGHVIASILSNSHIYTGLDKLAPLLLSCWKYARNPSTCILLDSNDTISNNITDNQMIIHPKELFDFYLLPALQNDDTTTLLTNNILGLIYTLTEDTSPTSEKWGQQLDQHVSYIPMILDMDVVILMKTLGKIMNQRYITTTTTMNNTLPEFTGTLALSMALDLGRKLTMTIRHFCTLFENTLNLSTGIKAKLTGFYSDDYYDYDWRTQVFWEESYRYIVSNHSPPHYSALEVLAPFKSITDSAGKETDMNFIMDSQWIRMLNGCRSSTLFTNELFECDGTRNYNLKPIWKHPYECNLLHEYLVQNLHPAFSIAIHYEYRLLLIYFLGRLYDTHENGDDMIRLYRNYDATAIPLVKLLTTEHCRIFFMALHSLLLLKTAATIKTGKDMKRTTIDDGELYFVSGIIQAIQAMTNWDNFAHTTQTLTRKQISTMAHYPENRIEPSDLTTDPSTTSKPDIVDCQYPWMNDPKRRSGRALCLLMIQSICQVANSIRVRKSYDLLRVLLLQMVEKLEDRQQRNTFMDQYHNKQTKSFINKWKKNKKDRRIRVHLRPTLTSPDEMALIKNCYSHLPSMDDQSLLRNLLTSPYSSSFSPILYIYNSHSHS